MNWAAPLSLVLIVAWIAGCAQAPQEQKIGAILPLTGPASYIGEEARNAILLADPEGQVAIDDSKGDAKQAVLAASRMMDKNISYLIAWMSGPSGAVAPLAQERHAVLLVSFTRERLIATVVRSNSLIRNAALPVRMTSKN